MQSFISWLFILKMSLKNVQNVLSCSGIRQTDRRINGGCQTTSVAEQTSLTITCFKVSQAVFKRSKNDEFLSVVFCAELQAAGAKSQLYLEEKSYIVCSVLHEE